MRILNKLFKRFYHPGYGSYNSKKLCLPYCPENQISKYYKPVWGNKIQEIQLDENEFSYNTNEINYYSNKIRILFNNNTIYIPTSHNTPIKTALQSCRNLKKLNNYLCRLPQLNVTNSDGVFINNEENRNKLMLLVNFADSREERIILKNAFHGIFSNFGDSIYIANDYLQVSDNHVIISNYPNEVSQREIERCRIVAYNLLFGNYPILLDKDVSFEGEANIKFIPAIIQELWDSANRNTPQQHQMCISYNSSRSDPNCINNINKYLDRLKLPLLKPIQLSPKREFRNYFYHLDCIMNFSVNSSNIQYFNSYSDFLENYKRNGIVIYEENGFKQEYIEKLNKMFETIIPVNKEDDLLCANMIVTENNIVGSSKLKNKDNIPNFYNFNHPSHGGGGAHKCCSNTLNMNQAISIDDWLSFSQDIGIDIDDHFIEGVKSEIERINNVFII